jgi:hypothetical protein
MKQEIEQYVRCCEVCQKNKITYNKTKVLLQITTPDVACEKCSLDIVGPLTTTLYGNRYILTFQDQLSKYKLVVPIPQQHRDRS